MGIESNKEAVAMMKNALGSIENRFREAYNKGYKDGLRDGASQVMAKLVSKILEETEADTPQTETQTETQNSNLTFEKRTMRDCYNCKRYETEGECIECHYEPKDEPTISKMEQVETMSCQECKHFNGNDGCDVMTSPTAECKYEPQTEEERCRDVVRGFMDIVNDMRNPTEEEKECVNKYIESISKPTGLNVFDLMTEPQTDCAWRER